MDFILKRKSLIVFKMKCFLSVNDFSLNFVTCRQDDATADMEVTAPQSNKTFNKGAVVVSDTVRPNLAQRPVDPDPPVKDGTSW